MLVWNDLESDEKLKIYDKGIAGVSRDYAESLKWYNAARVLGEDVPMAKSR